MVFMRVRALAAVAAVSCVLTAVGSAGAFSKHDNPAEQQRAQDNCSRVTERQFERGVGAGGGHKEGLGAPTNCDHFYNP